MKPIFSKLFAVLLFSSAAHAGSAPNTGTQDVDSMLDAFHTAASEGDFETYFSLFMPDGVFLGTDKTERWTVEEFKAFAKPIFDQGRGWTYIKTHRNIDYSPDGKTVYFDEILQNEAYGTSRGTGVVFLTDEGWKIGQYHLTFPIPNALAGDMTERIKAFEAEQIESGSEE